MEKLWAGRTDGVINAIADDFNSSINVDQRMYLEDIKGSCAHATMLKAKGIISAKDLDDILGGLEEIEREITSGALPISPESEDIHSFIEGELTRRVGDAGRRLHTARSRNDQVAVDVRLYCRKRAGEIKALLAELLTAITDKAEEYKTVIMPGYTHLQRAQPILFAHHLLAYGEMIKRDIGRLEDAASRMNYSPLGACALAGTTYSTDRGYTASALGFTAPMANSIDAVSDRDFALELLSFASVLMVHLSRFSEELILWSSWEFRFVELDTAFTTGSSIMPQKKNSDMAELVRGKSGRVFGDLMGMLTMLKGIPLAYNKDMQEDKESLFDALDTVEMCLKVFAPMVATLKAKPDNMYKAATEGFINATDLADYLTKRGVPFRTAYKLVGSIVQSCAESGRVLEQMPLEEYKRYSEVFSDDLYEEISLETCVRKRISEGGTGYSSVEKQISDNRNFLKEGI